MLQVPFLQNVNKYRGWIVVGHQLHGMTLRGVLVSSWTLKQDQDNSLVVYMVPIYTTCSNVGVSWMYGTGGHVKYLHSTFTCVLTTTIVSFCRDNVCLCIIIIMCWLDMYIVAGEWNGMECMSLYTLLGNRWNGMEWNGMSSSHLVLLFYFIV